MEYTQSVKGDRLGTGRRLLEEARNIGLLEPGEVPDNIDAVHDLLEEVQNWTPDEISIPEGDRLSQLQQEHENRSDELEGVEKELTAVRSHVQSYEGYAAELDQQRLRLEPVELFSSIEGEGCPLCESDNEVLLTTHIEESLRNVGERLESTSRSKPKLQEYIEEKEKEKEDILGDLRDVEGAINGIIEQREEARRIRDLNVRKSRVVGRISLWLESYEATEDGGLKEQIEEAEAGAERIRKKLEDRDEDERLESILRRVSSDITSFANELNLEWTPDPVRLQPSKLSLVVDAEEGPIRFEEMGSAKNWLGYSLALHLALHKHFVSQDRPVPHFLVLDQPTQVYYPNQRDQELEGSIEGLSDHEEIKRILDLIFSVSADVGEQFQIIILDHADIDDPAFQEAVIERWRGGKKLVPEEWLN